jgi:hypothetical protein
MHLQLFTTLFATMCAKEQGRRRRLAAVASELKTQTYCPDNHSADKS